VLSPLLGPPLRKRQANRFSPGFLLLYLRDAPRDDLKAALISGLYKIRTFSISFSSPMAPLVSLLRMKWSPPVRGQLGTSPPGSTAPPSPFLMNNAFGSRSFSLFVQRTPLPLLPKVGFSTPPRQVRGDTSIFKKNLSPSSPRKAIPPKLSPPRN